ncbi:putative DNA-directed DNA polymerase [Rosa chinensis]|uniref:Putative DNA-directed DNA polymerase n=1 Tax=Rosa chinensis TaxID=74649 RepID=A0A2P6QRC9_ROSCH|nr:putative DNA-directed DNA polymerase [Rosa chinensis]
MELQGCNTFRVLLVKICSSLAETKEKIVANLENFAYDPYNYTYLRQTIYYTVDEDEYDAIIAKQSEEFGDFIEDDDGLGYRDDGEEEDWTRHGLPTSSDESDGDMRPKRRKTVEKKEKEPRPKKPNSSLTAAAEMMGKQRLSSMFTSPVFNKSRDGDKAKGLSCDSIVDDVIAEFVPDEADRERRMRAQPARSFVPITGVKSERVREAVHVDGEAWAWVGFGCWIDWRWRRDEMVAGDGVLRWLQREEEDERSRERERDRAARREGGRERERVLKKKEKNKKNREKIKIKIENEGHNSHFGSFWTCYMRIRENNDYSVNYAIGSFYYLCNASNKEVIMKPEVIDVMNSISQAASVSFSILAEAFL